MADTTPTTVAPLLTLADLGRMLNIGRRKAWELAVTRTVPGFRIGREWRFKPDDVQAWIDAKAAEGAR